MDQRNSLLAKNLVDYSCDLKSGEKILIRATGESSFELINEIVKVVYKKSAIPFVKITDSKIDRQTLLEINEEQAKLMLETELLLLKEIDAFISINAPFNTNEISDVPSDKMQLYRKFFNKKYSDIVTNSTKWVGIRYPNDSMAQSANMSLEAFENLYYKVCNLDYNKMSIAMDNLVKYMEKSDRVKIIGKGTNLEFSIKDIPVVKCSGENNIPDGEVFTAPVKNSVNGTLLFNTPSIYDGCTYQDVCLTFEKGKIINATSNNTEKINAIFDTDEGARYIGEFSFGVNPYILEPICDTLFDEKIMGSFHFTPGNAYTNADNGNRSAIHWDLVCIQTEKHGGGEIYFDDILIRKNGLFVIDELKCLNPENLI